jgi:ABC-type branched-subunit amino acid transport system ATPase component
MTALLAVEGLRKEYRRGWFARAPSFVLNAQLRFDAPQIVAVLGPNGSGKTTLFELITGSNLPTAGAVRVVGQDIHRVRKADRGRLARHYHQSYQVRRFRAGVPDWFLQRSRQAEPLVHLFDEPQFNTQDGYIGFMLRFFRNLRAQDKLVFVCLHPNEPWQLELLRELAERFVFVNRGNVTVAPDFTALLRLDGARDYLAELLPAGAAAGGSPRGANRFRAPFRRAAPPRRARAPPR